MAGRTGRDLKRGAEKGWAREAQQQITAIPQKKTSIIKRGKRGWNTKGIGECFQKAYWEC